MCAIVDANVAGEVFGSSPQPAAKRFFDWVNKGSGRLVAGGKLLRELELSSGFSVWAAAALRAGKMRIVNEGKVIGRTEELIEEGRCRSNDPHVLALAQISGARLLYSNDKDLQQDFKDSRLIHPEGYVYSTLKGKKLTSTHKRHLGRRDLCRIREQSMAG